MSERFDFAALKSGAAVALMFAVPFQIIALLLRDHDKKSPWLLPLALLTLLGFLLGAGVAAWRQDRRTPLTHGIVASAGTFIVVEAIFIIVKLLRGSSVDWFADFFTLTTTVVVGMFGGLLGMNLQKRGLEPKR